MFLCDESTKIFIWFCLVGKERLLSMDCKENASNYISKIIKNFNFAKSSFFFFIFLFFIFYFFVIAEISL